jgi:hypothetical protein
MIPIDPFRNVMPKELMILIVTFKTVMARKNALPIDKFIICMPIELINTNRVKKRICL